MSSNRLINNDPSGYMQRPASRDKRLKLPGTLS
jgi:hypothetical protein